MTHLKKLFVCVKCGKEIQVEEKIYDKIYLGEDKCLDCRTLDKKKEMNIKTSE